MVKTMNNEEWHIHDLTLPHSSDSPITDSIEVDPEYK